MIEQERELAYNEKKVLEQQLEQRLSEIRSKKSSHDMSVSPHGDRFQLRERKVILRFDVIAY